MCQRTTRPDKSMLISRWLAFAARLGRWTGIALVAPAQAVVPILAVALAAYLAGSDAFPALAEAAFATYAIACPAAFLIGLPAHVLLQRLVRYPPAQALMHVVAGVLVGWLLGGLHEDRDTWPETVWLGLCWQGGLTGWWFWRLGSVGRRAG